MPASFPLADARPVLAAVDYETDAVIQKSLREELGKDVTVLTVAHRLRTVMDADKIVSPHPSLCAC